jgi:hypothetical protein
MGKPLIQRWSPDTCGCQIVMVKDDRDLDAEFHFVEGTVRDSNKNEVEGMVKCPAHKALTRAGVWEATYADPDSENKRKNLMVKELMEDLSIGLAEDVQTDKVELEEHPVLGHVPKLDATGQPVRQVERRFKPGVEVRHVFKGEGLHRELEMWVVGAQVTPAMRQKLDACAERCGSARRPITVKAQVEIG